MNKDNVALRFLYGTLPGRCILRILISRPLSSLSGRLLDSRASSALIPFFIRSYHISVKDLKIPKEGFPSFNSFFCREKLGRGCNTPSDKCVLSPCDAFLSVLPVTRDTCMDIKHTSFTLEELLKNSDIAKEFSEGTALIFRLCPQHYHRYSYAVNGKIERNVRLKGVFHCVRPIATEKYPVFAQNARQYQVINTECFGRIVQMEVGALLIGRITNRKVPDRIAVQGREKGYFEYGGSTIILLFQKGKCILRPELEKELRDGREFPVTEGMILSELS